MSTQEPSRGFGKAPAPPPKSYLYLQTILLLAEVLQLLQVLHGQCKKPSDAAYFGTCCYLLDPFQMVFRNTQHASRKHACKEGVEGR
eukprot:1043324-Pelagomonas_calceolata.AAC.6